MIVFLDLGGFFIVGTSSRVGAEGQSALHSVERRGRKSTEFECCNLVFN